MGANVFKDINSFDEKSHSSNGKKVVIIYATAGNLNDDDTKSCLCRDPYNQYGGRIPYWKVREEGAKNSIHLAACRIGGWGPVIPYPRNKTVSINGHTITKYEFKNTVNYFLRINARQYGHWNNDVNATAETVDNSTTYKDWADFVNTLYYIYTSEIDSTMALNNISFNFPDINDKINPEDHRDHYITGRGSYEAAKILSANSNTCYTASLFIDYHSQNIPSNLNAPDVQNEAALTSVYCLALLDYNAWPEWGNQYQNWTDRNYYRRISTCDNPTTDNVLARDSMDVLNVKIYPNPADKELSVKFNIPVRSSVKIKVLDVKGVAMFEYNGGLNSDSYSINTADLPNGNYMALIGTENTIISKIIFEVAH